jgi:uncharacterized damage-inducible protein DinB
MHMFEPIALLDLHRRGHRSLQGMMRHCAGFTPEELGRELPGFGYPDILRQLEHAIGAEEYWMSVIEGRFQELEEGPAPLTMEALEAYRLRVAEVTDAWLGRSTAEELATAREMWTWPGKMRLLVPELVFLRTLTHIYQHQGQVLAMCRLLGRPHPGGLDFPLD